MSFYRGVWAASVTPLFADLSIDFANLIKHVRYLLDSGCHGVVLLGTTGEANSFSVRERIELMDTVVQSGLPIDRIIIGTGCTAHEDTVALSGHAARCQFRGVLLLPPFYYKNVSDDGLYASINAVTDSLGAACPEIVLYHFPALAGVGFSHELIARLSSALGDRIVGVKDSTGDASHTASLIESFPALQILAGNEVLLPEVVPIGGAGCISASVNLTAAHSREVYEALISSSATFPEDTMDTIRSIRSSVSRFPMASSVKSVMSEMAGSNEMTGNVRPPLTATIPDQGLLEIARSLLSDRAS
jgi:4-hydroxy-tetrahydrodipicolinate synthase